MSRLACEIALISSLSNILDQFLYDVVAVVAELWAWVVDFNLWVWINPIVIPSYRELFTPSFKFTWHAESTSAFVLVCPRRRSNRNSSRAKRSICWQLASNFASQGSETRIKVIMRWHACKRRKCWDWNFIWTVLSKEDYLLLRRRRRRRCIEISSCASSTWEAIVVPLSRLKEVQTITESTQLI